jgi:hypothetical protein
MEIVELGWSPLVTVIYVVWCLATARSLDPLLLAALIALNITCIVYARKLHEKRESRVEPPMVRREVAPAEQKREVIEAPAVEARREPQAPRVEVKKEPVEAPRVEAKKETKEAPRVEPRASLKELEEAKGEAERWKQGAAGLQTRLDEQNQRAATLQTQLDEQNRRAAERLDVVLAVTNVKERARAIRRQWPDAAFCQRPLREQWWTPNANQTASTPWLAKAREWQSLFTEARARFFPGAPGDVYFRSLDLEEVIDFLDDVILSRETRPLHRETQVTPATAPVLKITGWAAPEGEFDKCGFLIRNSGEFPASNIQLAPARVGSRSLSIFLPASQSVAKDQQLFVIATLSGPQRVTAYNLEEVMQKLPANGINGAKPLGIPLRLSYDSKDGNRYLSRHEMTLEDMVIKIGYVNTEAAGMAL